jgi:hypothetical protein
VGLISICPARRFLEGAGWKHVQAETEILLTTFFDAMGAKCIYLQADISPRIAALVKSETGISISELDVETEPQSRAPKTNIFPVKLASGECSLRMTQIPQLSRVSAGISFGIDEEPKSPRTRWSLVLHRGPLPLLEIGISDERGFNLPGGWPTRLIGSEAAHVLWITGKGYLGASDHLYLWLKREKLFPNSKGDPSEEAVAAGQRLRQLCRNAWLQHGGQKTDPHNKLSSWRWSQKRFVKNFNNVLLSYAKSQELREILEIMGTDLDHWLGAS